MEKKKYITTRDRTWKGKDWFSSFRSTKFIRTLTQKEADSLDCIQEVPKPKPFVKCRGDNNGRMFCLLCKSTRGFYIYQMHRGKQINWYMIYKCSDCGEREKKMCITK